MQSRKSTQASPPASPGQSVSRPDASHVTVRDAPGVLEDRPAISSLNIPAPFHFVFNFALLTISEKASNLLKSLAQVVYIAPVTPGILSASCNHAVMLSSVAS